jgi:hypothetical protein
MTAANLKKREPKEAAVVPSFKDTGPKRNRSAVVNVPVDDVRDAM